MRKFLGEVKPGLIRFGGAEGTDYLSMLTAYRAFRDRWGRGPSVPQLVLTCPCTVAELPSRIRGDLVSMADVIEQLHQPIVAEDGWRAFHNRNEWMIFRSAGLLYFDNGDRESGSSSTARKARDSGVDVVSVSL